jgi:phosphoribosyl 1,2-cyclic phosphate phosphodiesterase
MTHYTFTGTGTSQGVPLIGCTCKVCTSSNIKDSRLRTAFHIQSDTTSVCIDTGPDFRQQMIVNKIHKLDAVVFTHHHKDHIAGLDDIRAYNYTQQQAMDVYANALTIQNLHREFPYIFDGNNYPGIPQINLTEIKEDTIITIGNITLQPLPVLHYKLPVFGYLINNTVAYITDANNIPPQVMSLIKHVPILVLTALRLEPHISHFNLSQAIDIAQQCKAGNTYLTHISHQLGLHHEVSATLPPSVHLAFDNLKISL